MRDTAPAQSAQYTISLQRKYSRLHLIALATKLKRPLACRFIAIELVPASHWQAEQPPQQSRPSSQLGDGQARADSECGVLLPNGGLLLFAAT